jgi:uncharacterized protein YlaI
MESVSGTKCWICSRSTGKLDRHEIFHGASREKSKRLGLWLTLCHECHLRLHQKESRYDKLLKIKGQEKAMEYYGWSEKDFIKQIGKNYL